MVVLDVCDDVRLSFPLSFFLRNIIRISQISLINSRIHDF
jgi:hypothetical protein